LCRSHNNKRSMKIIIGRRGFYTRRRSFCRRSLKTDYL
jgi:hypothetical protein